MSKGVTTRCSRYVELSQTVHTVLQQLVELTRAQRQAFQEQNENSLCASIRNSS